MTKKTRKIVFIFFIVLFFLITGGVIPYASGYRFDFKKIKIQKTGMIVINSTPPGALVYINNKPIYNEILGIKKSEQLTTPTKIKGILPGEYEIKLEKDGYWEWTKKIEIQESENRLLNEIYFSKREIPILITNGVFDDVFISPQKNTIIALGEKKAFLINEKNIEKNIEINTDYKGKIQWSKNEENLIIGSDVINSKTGKKVIDLKNIISADKIKWNPNNENEINYIDNSDFSLKTLDINTLETKIIAKEDYKILDFYISDNHVYTLKSMATDNGIALETHDLESDKLIKAIYLPLPTHSSFAEIKNEYIILNNENYNSVTILNTESFFPVKETVYNINNYNWIENNTILFANDFEIFKINLESGKKTILTRISKNITNMIYLKKTNHTVYSTKNTINIFDEDQNENGKTTEFIKLDKISSLYLSSDEKVIYFYGEIGNQKGIYKISL